MKRRENATASHFQIDGLDATQAGLIESLCVGLCV